MKLEDYKSIKNSVVKQYNESNTKIGETINKIKTIDSFSMDQKFFNSLALGMIPYFVLVLASKEIAAINLIPAAFLPASIISASALFGAVVEKIINKKVNPKKNKNSNKTKDLVEIKTRYEIEKALIIAKRDILEKIYETTISDIDTMESLNDRYELTEKKVDNRTVSEIESEINLLEEELNKANEQLKLIMTKYVLKEKFRKYRSKFEAITDAIVTYGMGGGLMAMLVFDMPYIYMKSFISNYQIGFLTAVAPLFIGGIASSAYAIKKYHSNIKSFKKINSELGPEALKTKAKGKEEKEIDLELSKVIDQVYNIKAALVLQMQELEIKKSFSAVEEQNKAVQVKDEVITKESVSPAFKIDETNPESNYQDDQAKVKIKK